MREEDPFTAAWTAVAPTRVIGLRSRFEVDLNRPRDSAVYRTPNDAWGLTVWNNSLPDEVATRSLQQYDAFYQMLDQLYAELAEAYGSFVVFDLHTYNHRRAGPDQPAADPEGNPAVNVGTASLGNRQKFGPLVQRFLRDLGDFEFPGGRLDVRENVKFFGGNHPRWAHARFPDQACVIAIEFKKFFMDEWTAQPDQQLLAAIPPALAATVPGVLEELDRLPGRDG